MADNKALTPDDVTRIVLLAFGAMEQGGEYWCYVAVKPSKHDEFRRVLATKSYNIQNFEGDGFGEVIVSGDGGLPPKDVTRQVAELFNVPLRKLFDHIDPEAVIARHMENLKNAEN